MTLSKLLRHPVPISKTFLKVKWGHIYHKLLYRLVVECVLIVPCRSPAGTSQVLSLEQGWGCESWDPWNGIKLKPVITSIWELRLSNCPEMQDLCLTSHQTVSLSLWLGPGDSEHFFALVMLGSAIYGTLRRVGRLQPHRVRDFRSCAIYLPSLPPGRNRT